MTLYNNIENNQVTTISLYLLAYDSSQSVWSCLKYIHFHYTVAYLCLPQLTEHIRYK